MCEQSLKEDLSKLIIDISKDLISIYKNEILSAMKNIQKVDKLDMELIIANAQKKYQNSVALDCANRIGEIDRDVKVIMLHVLDNPVELGFSDDDFENGQVAGFVLCAAYYAFTGRILGDPEYCIELNHLQTEIILEAINEIDLSMQVSEGDRFSAFKKQHSKDVDELFAGVIKTTEMFIKNNTLYKYEPKHEDMARIVGLCAYLIAAWATTASPELAEQICYMYGNNFQLLDAPIEFANEMLDITNSTYREIRSITDKMILNTHDVDAIIDVQARKFMEIADIDGNDCNLKTVKENIYYFINQYLI